MSPQRVSISRRTARDILGYLDGEPIPAVSRCAEELRRALQSGIKKGKARAEARRKRALKGESKRDETRLIRAAVFERAGGRCELCQLNRPEHLHHAFGRIRVEQLVENCIAVCRWCHDVVTLNTYGAEHTWEIQARHFQALGYRAEEGMALRNLRRAKDKAALSLASQSEAAGKRVQP